MRRQYQLAAQWERGPDGSFTYRLLTCKRREEGLDCFFWRIEEKTKDGLGEDSWIRVDSDGSRGGYDDLQEIIYSFVKSIANQDVVRNFELVMPAGFLAEEGR